MGSEMCIRDRWEVDQRAIYKILEGETGICSVHVFFDAVNKISICVIAVISNLTVCDVCIFHAAVFGNMKLFAGLWFPV